MTGPCDDDCGAGLHRIIWSLLVLGMALTAATAGFSADQPTERVAPQVAIRVVGSYPHDSGAFTQGLVFADGYLYEGTGKYGRSSLRRVDVTTGQVLLIAKLPNYLFGEGVAVVDDRIVQLTWKSQIGLVFSRGDFQVQEIFRYPREGWGLTYDGRHLIMSDGSSVLFLLDPESFQTIGSIEVFDGAHPLEGLNELEYIDGVIYANIWKSDQIAQIDAGSGQVMGWVDLEDLLAPSIRKDTDVLNGIAFNPITKRLYVTGKFWPRLFEIEIIPHALSMVRGGTVTDLATGR